MIKLNNIYNKNCIEFTKELESNSMQVDIGNTSPPYNIKKTMNLPTMIINQGMIIFLTLMNLVRC